MLGPSCFRPSLLPLVSAEGGVSDDGVERQPGLREAPAGLEGWAGRVGVLQRRWTVGGPGVCHRRPAGEAGVPQHCGYWPQSPNSEQGPGYRGLAGNSAAFWGEFGFGLWPLSIWSLPWQSVQVSFVNGADGDDHTGSLGLERDVGKPSLHKRPVNAGPSPWLGWGLPVLGEGLGLGGTTVQQGWGVRTKAARGWSFPP